MRFAAITALAGLLFVDAPATGQDNLVEGPGEPPLDSIIAQFFPGYAPVTPGDLSADVRRVTAADSAYDDPARSPTVIHADFDGNGVADYAVLVRELASANPDEVFAVLMGHGQGRYSAAMKAFFGGLLSDVYLGYIPAGEQLAPPPGSRQDRRTVRLARPAVRLVYHRRAADAFYWNQDAGRFDSVPLER